VSLDEIGIQLFAQEKFEEALTVFNEARTIRTKTLGANHPKVAMVMNNIACCNFQMGDSLAALETFKEARDIQQQSLAMGSSAKANLDLLHVATTSCNYGYMHLRLKHYEEAQTIFEENLLVCSESCCFFSSFCSFVCNSHLLFLLCVRRFSSRYLVIITKQSKTLSATLKLRVHFTRKRREGDYWG
jgi:tetratricopeptide (TPR) repeat protein